MSRKRWITALSGLTFAALAAVACLVPATASAEASRPQLPRVPVLHWRSCEGSFQCATARVPLDYRHPLGKTISIVVIRHRATDPARRLGSLFFNSGGPAEQIGPFLASYALIPAELRTQDRYTGPWNRHTANPILLIGNTVDPATPYSNSVAMSHDLARARLLTVKGYGHTEFTNPSTCASKYEVRFLITGALPPVGTVCRQTGVPFGPST
jgi:hypothetical protein